jgi:hypothetical protein
VSLAAHIKDVINRFIHTGSVNKRDSTGRLPESEEAVED